MKGPRLISENIGTFELRLYAAPSYIERMGLPAASRSSIITNCRLHR